jgi:hypothetical protein
MAKQGQVGSAQRAQHQRAPGQPKQRRQRQQRRQGQQQVQGQQRRRPQRVTVRLLAAVRTVLRDAPVAGPNKEQCFLTAYQILERLPQVLRDRLINALTSGGTGAGVKYAASNHVSMALRVMMRRKEIDHHYLDAKEIRIGVAGTGCKPSATCGIFRLKPPPENT